MSLSCSVTGREFQRHGPATEKLLSPRRVRVLLVAQVKTSADHSDRQPTSVKSNNVLTKIIFLSFACGQSTVALCW